LQESWRCEPKADESCEFIDDFGNRVLELRHTKIEHELLFELSCEADYPNSFATSARGLPQTGIGAFLLPSALCDMGGPVPHMAEQFNPQRGFPLEQVPLAICSWLHHSQHYKWNETTVQTTASQSLGRGVGVCQDFAHAMIALCRAIALPARYVSGYLIGEGRMHAWVEVLIDNQWRAFDPTHNRQVGKECLPIAIGRDFRDCNPHQGTFRGHASAKLESGCRVSQAVR
jgi:transglutaminase-like putative cysteine protease